MKQNRKLTLLIALSIIFTITIGMFIPIVAANQTDIVETPTDVTVVETPTDIESKTSSIVESKVSSVVSTPKKVKSVSKPKEVKPVSKPKEKVEKPTVTGEYSIPNINTSFKSWMPYTAITNKGSAAYKQQKKAYTDENGLRKINDDYCVAMGTYYSSTIGERFKITMSTGKTFTVIISDIKSDRHTDSTHRYTASNNCMMEFLIDSSCLANCIRTSGNVGSLSLFKGQFVKVEKIS